LLDLFTIEGSRLVYRRSDDGWQGARYVEGHDASVSVPAFTSVAADFAGTRLDVFAVGNDGVLYYYYASTLHDDPEWIGPFSFYYYGADVARVGAGIGAASMSTTRFDVFAITSPGALGHVFGNEVYPTAEGWLSAFPYLVPLAPVAWASGMEVVSPWPTRLDVFFLSLSGRAFQHHWYDQSDGSYWGPDESPQREEIALDDATLAGGGIDALATAARAQGIDVFVRVAAATPRLYRLLYREGTWGVSNPSVGRPEPIALATCPERLFAAISWRGASVDLFGADADHRVWHSWFH
jgi:hypothetical protein